MAIAEIKLVQALNGHVVEEGCRENIDSLRNFRFPLPDQLSTEKPSSTFISADSKNDFLGAGIVSFVIPMASDSAPFRASKPTGGLNVSHRFPILPAADHRDSCVPRFIPAA